MKVIPILGISLLCLLSVSAVAQKKVPYSFHYQSDTSGRNQLRFLTQVTQPNTTFLRLYFAGTQLGESSYLVLEGSDGARQELRKPDLENWHYSSAYFNGQSVNVSLLAATGEQNTVRVSEVKVTDPQAGQARNARRAAKTTGTALQTVTSTSADLTEYPYAKAVGRFTNGTEASGTGWIAPNGAIVTSWRMYEQYFYTDAYDVIEFNVPPSVGGTVMHPSPQDQYPLNARNQPRSSTLNYKDTPRVFAHVISYGWVIFEPLPNSITGLRPGERQQEYFRIGQNPGNFTINAKGDGGLPVNILHYGNGDGDALSGTALKLTETSLLKQNDYLMALGNGDRDRFVLYDTPLSLINDAGAPITYAGSNVAIGVHNESSLIFPDDQDIDNDDFSMPGHGIGFRDEAFRNEVRDFYASNSVYVDIEGENDGASGQIHKPYTSAQSAATHASNGAQVYIARGTYYGAATFNRPMTLRAPVGKVTLGAVLGSNPALPSRQRQAYFDEPSPSFDQESAEDRRVRAYPNPFHEQTEIKYPFTEGDPVSVDILNTAGVRVATFNQTNGASARNGVQWNGTDQTGRSVPAGLYLVKVNNGRHTFTTKVLKQ